MKDISSGLATAAYMLAGVLFVLALGGFSHPEKIKRRRWHVILGVAVAIFTAAYWSSFR
jgi:NAD(P) transhydrogenase subunit beta